MQAYNVTYGRILRVWHWSKYAGTVETLLRSLAPDAELIIVNGTIANLHDVF